MTLVRGGEDTFLELKVKLSNPESIAQGIVALANTGGGVIVFGVNDNLRVEGWTTPKPCATNSSASAARTSPRALPLHRHHLFRHGHARRRARREGKRRPYRTNDGRYFLRVGAEKREATREELSALLDETRPSLTRTSQRSARQSRTWTRRTCGASCASSSRTPSTRSRRARLPDRRSAGARPALAVPAAAGPTDGVAPTVAGLLLFGRDERVAELLPARPSRLALRGRHTQSPKVESVELAGNLHTL